jgi:hypothetical protein
MKQVPDRANSDRFSERQVWGIGTRSCSQGGATILVQQEDLRETGGNEEDAPSAVIHGNPVNQGIKGSIQAEV